MLIIDKNPLVDIKENIVANPNNARVDDLEKTALFEALSTHGYLILRGYEATLADFNGLVERVSASFSLDPAREFHGNVAQKVDAGFDEVGLHCENGNSPFWPDLAWFYCQVAASHGSQTTVCDGREVWHGLSDLTRELFLKNDIVYSRKVEERAWKEFIYHSMGGALSLEAITLEHLHGLINSSPTASIDVLENNAVRYYYRTPAARKTLFCENLSFANSILGPSYNYETPKIEFVNGEKITEEVIAEIQHVTSSKTKNIDWKNGDIAIIDNTRVMHGRRKIEDSKREIYNALSYI